MKIFRVCATFDGGFDEASLEISNCWCGVSLVYVVHHHPGIRVRRPNAAGLVSQILTPLIIAAGAGATFF
jgi:hypothetical protein